MPDAQDDSLPATKAQLNVVRDELKADIKRLDQKTDLAAQRLDQKVDGLDQKVDVVAQRLDQKIDRVGLEVIKTNGRLDKLEETIREEFRRWDAKVTEKLESFASRIESLWRESAVLPRVVDQHGAALRDHEGRLKALESPKP